MTQARIKPEALQTMIANLILTAAVNLEKATGQDKEKWVTERLTAQVEQYDQLIPGLKEYADLPFVDELEKKGIEQLTKFCVRKAYAWALATDKLPGQKATPPSVQPSAEDKKVADALGVPADVVLTPAAAASGNTIRSLSAPVEPTPPPPPVDNPAQPDTVQQPSKQEQQQYSQVTPESSPNAQDDTGGSGGDDDESPDFSELAEDYSKGGGWYEFPPKNEGEEPVKKQGKEAAIEYLKTRDDLVYE